MRARNFVTALAAASLAGLMAAPALAQDSEDHPNLEGFYYSSRGEVIEDPEIMAAIAPNTARLHDLGPVEFPAGDYGGLEPKPEALAIAKDWAPEKDMTLSKACEVPGMLYTMQGPFPFKILQGEKFIIIQLEYYDLTRIVFMDGRDHLPEDAPHTKMGHSVGHWEGDTLVIETTHLAPATITNNGLDFSDGARAIERYTLSEDGSRLIGSQEFEDPAVLNNRGVRVLNWDRSPVDAEYLYPYECDPSFAANFGVQGD